MPDASIFRQAVLDRLASPEQLHTLMKVTDARGWLALIGCGALLATALTWGVLGSVPTKVRASGILIHSGGLADVVANSTGQITALEVDAGDLVQRGMAIAQLAQPELEAELAGLQKQLAELRLVHEQSKELGTVDVKLRGAASAQEASTLKSTIAATEQRKRELTERLASQQRLYDKGLVTKEALQTTQQALRAAEASVHGMRADIQRVAVDRFSATRVNDAQLQGSGLRLQETERQIKLLTQRLAQNTRVVSTHAGRVVEVRAMVGDVLAPGLPIVSLERSGEQGGLEALLYVDSREGKRLRPGMRVELSPSVARRERHGVLLAAVRAVEDFPSTRRGMMRVLHNEQLVEAFLAETAGTPIAVRARLQTDTKTASGYRWSSRRGPNLKLTSGTRCSAALTTSTQRPIALVLPILDMER
jgi:HlyD family secretion protein